MGVGRMTAQVNIVLGVGRADFSSAMIVELIQGR
jgi:hypothetical protein